MTPLDVVKVRLQAGQFTGSSDAFGKILRHEGVRQLYAGLAPSLVYSIPATVIYFATFDHLRATLGERIPEVPEWAVPVVCGCGARSVVATTMSPLELVRTQYQARTLSVQVGLVDALAHNIRLNGGNVVSLWRGLLATLWRDVPFSGLYWPIYEKCRDQLDTWRTPDTASVHFSHSFGAGCVSGSTACVLTQPFDVAKTRQQMEMASLTSKHVCVDVCVGMCVDKSVGMFVVCVDVCVRACACVSAAHAHARACVRACVCACVRACGHVCSKCGSTCRHVPRNV